MQHSSCCLSLFLPLHSPVEMSTSVQYYDVFRVHPTEYSFWEFCRPLPCSLLQCFKGRFFIYFFFLSFGGGYWERLEGPAVWSIVEVNLGRVTVPFVSLSPCTPGRSTTLKTGPCNTDFNMSVRKPYATSINMGHYCSRS